MPMDPDWVVRFYNQRDTAVLVAQGWRDHDDADELRHDPAFRLAASSTAGLTPLSGPGLASQPTLSRFTALMAEPANIKVLREAMLEFAGRGIRVQYPSNLGSIF